MSQYKHLNNIAWANIALDALLFILISFILYMSYSSNTSTSYNIFRQAFGDNMIMYMIILYILLLGLFIICIYAARYIKENTENKHPGGFKLQFTTQIITMITVSFIILFLLFVILKENKFILQ